MKRTKLLHYFATVKKGTGHFFTPVIFALLLAILALTFGASNFAQKALAGDDEASISAAQIAITNNPTGYTDGTTTSLDRTIYHAGDNVVVTWKGATAGEKDLIVPTEIRVDGTAVVNVSQLIKVDSIQVANSEYERKMGSPGTMTTYENLKNYVTQEHFISLGEMSTDSTVEVVYSRVSPVYRLYNTITSEHLFSTNKAEYDNFVALCEQDRDAWIGEGIDWIAPYQQTGSYSTVHRLYNEALGAMGHTSHYYSADAAEIADLCNNWGWTDDGVDNQFVSGGDVAIYTCYNEALGSAHHYTSSKSEWTGLKQHGWALEEDKNGTSPVKTPEGVFQCVTGSSFSFSPNYYTVEHQLQDSNGNYQTVERQVVEGTAGQNTVAIARNYPGYYVAAFENTTISSNNSTKATIQYDRGPYSIIYDKGSATDATNMPQTQSVLYGSNVVPSNDVPTAAGLTFGKWTLDAAGTQEVGNYTMPAGNLTLYAQWTGGNVGEDYVKVELKYNHESMRDKTEYVKMGASFNEPTPEPKVEGYTFLGWFTDEDCKIEFTGFGEALSSDITLYAKWTRYNSATTDESGSAVVGDPSTDKSSELNVLVQYDADDNAGTDMEPLLGAKVAFNEDGTVDVTLPEAATGHLVRVTITEKDGKTGIEGKPVTVINADGGVRDKNKKTDANGVVNFPATTAITTEDGTTTIPDANNENKTLKFEITYRAEDDNENMVALEGTRVELGSRNTIRILVPECADERTVSVKAYYTDSAPSGTVTKSIELYDYDYKTTSAMRGGSGKSITPTNESRNTATFAYYIVKFDTDGGEAVATERVYESDKVAKPADPTKAEANFDNWYTDKAYETVYNFTETVSSDTTIYAKFKPFTFNVSYILDGKYVKMEKVEINARATAPSPTPTKAGYTFDAWYVDENYSAVYDFGVAVRENKTLYGKWINNDNTNYTVTHVYEGLEGEESETVSVVLSGRTGDVVSATALEKTGFVVTGELPTIVIVPDGSGKGSVNYKRVENSVEYNKGDNAVSITPEKEAKAVMFGAKLTEPELVLKDGYKFAGWFRDAEFATAWDFATNTMPETPLTIYAKVVADTDMKYSVEHVYEGLNSPADDEVVLDDSCIGTTGDLTDAKVANKEGFTAGEVRNVEIAGDGSTKVSIKYTRNEFDVAFSNGGYGASPTSPVKYKFGAKLTEPNLGSVAGRKLAGWTYTDGSGNSGVWNFATSTLPNTTISLTALWVNESDVKYTVVHKFENLSGGFDEERDETGHGTTDSMTEAKPYTREGFTSKDFEQKTILGNGTTEVEIEYTRNVHTVTINAGEHGTVSNVPATSQKFGQTMTEPTITPNAGYEFDKWTYVDKDGITQTWDFANGMPDADIVITATWKTRGDTRYTVNFFEMDTEGNYPSTPTRSEVGYGTTETKTAVSASAKTGFEVKPIEQATITGDGKATVSVYYERQQYAVTFLTSSETFGWESHGSVDQDTVAVYYGAKIPEPKVTPDEGWKLNNSSTSGYLYAKYMRIWNFDSDVMPAESVELIISWTGNDDTQYTVIHKKESFIDGDYPYTNWEYETASGTTGQPTNASPKTGDAYVGFTPQTVTQQTISGDGKTEVVILYKRNTWNVSWDLGGGSGESTTRYGVKFGQTLATPQTPTREGYDFKGWKVQSGATVKDWNFSTDTMPNNNLTIYADWSARNDTKYTIKHFLQTVDKTGYAEDTTLRENLSGETARYVTASGKGIAGFTRTTGGDEVVSGYIKADGSLELKLYYNRNNYQVTITSGDHGVYSSTTSLVYGAKIDRPAVSAEGWTLANWTYVENGETKVWDFDNNTVPVDGVSLTAVWTPNSGISYKVEHKQQSLTDENVFETVLTEDLKGISGEQTKAVVQNYTGFSAGVVQNVAIDGSGNTVVEIKYTRNKRTITLDLGSHAKAEPSVFENVKFGQKLDFKVTVDEGYELIGLFKEASFVTQIDINNYTVPDSNEKLFAKVDAKTDTTYTVKHVYEGLNGAADEIVEKTQTGTTDQQSEARPEVKTGFSVSTTENVNIDGNGKAVATIKYTRNKHTVTFIAGDGATVSPTGHANVTYGDKFAQPTARKSGYDLIGWYEDKDDDLTVWNFSSSTMADRNVTLYAKWKVHNDTLYQIKHSFETLTAGVYQLDESKTQNMYGAANDPISKETVRGAAIKVDSQTEGFSYDDTSYPYIQQVGARVTTVITVKHKRLSYSITFDGGNKGTFNPNTRSAIKFGSKVTAPTIQPYSGYYFDGWYTDISLNNKIDLGTWTMPGRNTTIYAKFSSYGNTEYTVLHKREGLNSGEYPDTLVYRETKTGFTDGETAATALEFSGWTAVESSITKDAIKGDKSTTVEVKYTRNSYTISYNAGDQGDTVSTSSTSQKFEGSLVEPTVTPKGGYHHVGWKWSDEEGNSGTWDFATSKVPAKNITITALWAADTDTAYKVEHYQQKVDKSGYELKETTEQTGTTGQKTSPLHKSYTGFVFEKTENVDISGDGKSVAKVYYTRITYNLNFATNNTLAGSVDWSACGTTAVFGSILKEPTLTTNAGYTFAGYTDQDGNAWVFGTNTVQDKDLTITANWTKNKETKYVVQHWFESPTDAGQYPQYLVEKFDRTGETEGTTEAYEQTDKVGFTVVPGWKQETIKGDGTTTVNIYYTRNAHTVTFNGGGQTVTPETQSVKFGTAVTAPYIEPKVGYTLQGWFTQANGQGEQWIWSTNSMPNNAITLFAYWTPNEVNYTIAHHYPNLDGTTDVVEYETGKTATADSTITVAEKARDGFTVDKSTLQGKINADGSTTIDVRYTRNTYTVTFDYNDKVTATRTEQKKFEEGISNPNATRTGYSLNGWKYTDNTGVERYWDFANGKVPAYNLTLTADWTGDATTYTIKHQQENINDNNYTVVSTETRYGKAGEKTAVTANTYDGFTAIDPTNAEIQPGGTTEIVVSYKRNTYDVKYVVGNHGTIASGQDTKVKWGTKLTAYPGVTPEAGYSTDAYWYRDPEYKTTWNLSSDTVPIGGVTLYKKITANTNTKYTVKHLVQSLTDDSKYELHSAVTQTGTTGLMTDVKALNNAGLTTPVIVNQPIAGNGTTTIELKYDRKKFSVTFKDGSDFGTVYADKGIASVKYGATIAKPTDPSKSGGDYRFDGWFLDAEYKTQWIFEGTSATTMPARDVTLYAKFYDLNDTAYSVVHKYETINVSNGNSTGWETETQTLMGQVGKQTKAALNLKSGFYHSNAYNGNVLQSLVQAGGTTVTIEYKRNTYWTYYKGGDHGSVILGAKSFKYGQTLSVVDVYPQAGYEFAGWVDQNGNSWKVGDPMPANTVTLTAQYKAKGDVAYTVVHKREGTTEGTWTYEETKQYGTTGTATSATAKTEGEYAGFNVTETGVGTIKGDGSTKVTITYERKKHKVTLTNTNEHGTMTATTFEQKYGTTLERPKFDSTVEGWSVEKWTHNGNTWNFNTNVMPNNDIELKAEWGVTRFKVYFTTDQINIIGGITGAITFTGTESTVPKEFDGLTKLGGYKSKYWCQDKNGTGTQYRPGDKISFNFDYQDEEVTLWAIWNTESLDFNNFTVDQSDQTYTGRQIMPQVKSDKYKQGVDYKVTYDVNKNVGEGKITITGFGYFMSEKTYTFKIVQKSIKVSGITGKDRSFIEGNVDAELDLSKAVFDGKVDGDELGVSAKGKFADAAVADNKTVTIYDMVLTGSSAANYKLDSASQKTTSASITGTYYNVYFHGNGSTGTLADYRQKRSIYDSGDGYDRLLDCKFVKTSGDSVYGFKYWTTNADGSGTIYEDRYRGHLATRNDNQDVHLYAQWTTQPLGDFWVAESKTITTNNTAAAGAENATYNKPEYSVLWTQTELETNVNILINQIKSGWNYDTVKAYETNYIKVFTDMMRADEYHLYTKKNGTSGARENDYVEFRIIQVGEHDGDGTTLTFQSTHAMEKQSQIFDGDRYSQVDGDRNWPGWYSTGLQYWHLKDGTGHYYTQFNGGLNNWNLIKNVLKPYEVGGSVSNTSSKYWVISPSELTDVTGAKGSNGKSWETALRKEGSQYAYWRDVIGAKYASPNPAIVANGRKRDGSSTRGTMTETQHHTNVFWLRDSYRGQSFTFQDQDTYFATTNLDGSANGGSERYDSRGVVLCFSVGL